MRPCLLALVFLAWLPLLARAQPNKVGVPDGKDTAVPAGAFARLGQARNLALPGEGIALSPDGKLIAVGNRSGGCAIIIHDADSAKVARETEPKPNSRPTALAWSPNGSRLAALNSTAGLQVWDAATGKALWPGKLREVETVLASVSAFRFAGEDRFLALVGRPTGHRRSSEVVGSLTWYVELWDIEADKRKTTWTVDPTKLAALKALGNGYEFHHVVLSPLGERMAWLAAPPPDQNGKSAVFIYETATGKHLHTLRDLPRAYRMDLLDEAETLLLRPVRGAKPLEEVVTGQASVVSVPDGRVKFQCAYRLKPSAFVNPYSKWTHNNKGVSIDRTSVRFRDWLLVVDEVGMTRLDLKTGRSLDEYNEPFASFAISGDGRRIAIRDGLRLGISDGELATLKKPGVFARQPYVRFLPDGRLLGWDATREADGLLHVWDPSKRARLDTLRVSAWRSNYNGIASFDGWTTTMVYRTNSSAFASFDLTANKRLAVVAPPSDGYNVHASLSADGKRILVLQTYKPETNKNILAVRWHDARSGLEMGRHDVAFSQLPAQHLQAADWYSDDGSVFGYVTPDRRLTLVECESRKVRCTVGIPPSKEWKTPRWVYENPGYGRLIWARPYLLKGDNSAVADNAIWDSQGRLLRRFAIPSTDKFRNNNLLSHDGRTLAFSDSSQIYFFETASGRLRGSIRAQVEYLIARGFHGAYADFSPDCTTLATSDTNSILLWDLAKPLSGKTAYSTPKNVAAAAAMWENLGNPDPTESDRALWALVKAPEHALAMLKERLKPAPLPEAKTLQAAIKKLDSTSFVERDAAQKELRAMKETALPILRGARKSASVEQGRRLDEVIAEMQARLESRDGILANLRELRALEALERIGTPEARKHLAVIAEGADAIQTYEAQLILARWH